MGIGIGLFLIAIGAILTWAVTAHANGIDIHAVGVILMLVGLVGILIDLMWWHSWRAAAWSGYRRSTYVEGPPRRDGYWPRGRRTYVEEETGAPPPGPPPPP